MTDYRALCAELVKAWDATADFDFNDFGHAAADIVTRARAALAQPKPVVLTRPDCFNFAMDFLGGTEEVEVRNYIERLESAASAAQPEPAAPTDEEIEEWADAASEAPLEEMDPEIYGWRRCFTKEEFGASIRAALTRWGTPAIQPVPASERLPGPENKTTDDECWFWDPISGCWFLLPGSPLNDHYTHWLPHWALPVPGVEGADE